MAKRNAAPSKASTALNKRQNTGNRKVKPPKKPSVSPPATTKTTKADDVAEPIKLLLSMDYGTKTLSVAYRFVKPGEDATLANVPNVHFSEKEYYAPQKVAWAEDGTFYWGHDIDRAEKTKAIKTDQVIELFKLCLYEEHKTSDMALRVENQLGSRTLRELISTHLKHIVQTATDWIKRRHKSEYSEEFIDRLPTQLLLSVPQMWNSPANLEMTEAAKAAGIGGVQVVFEPQCAVAFYAHMTKDKLPRDIDIGDNILVCDPGGGTGDFALYEFKQSTDEGAKVSLALVEAKGALCGSEFVNQQFIHWLKQGKAGNFDAKCKQLGLSQTACIKQASKGFEAHKESFSVVTDDRVFVTVLGAVLGAQGAESDHWGIALTGHQIEAFFKPVVEKIFDCMEELRTEKTKVIIIPGGFGRSEYLLERLQERFAGIDIQGQHTPAVGEYQPVSRGAHLRYNDIVDHGMPANESFGIAQVETYDPDVHDVADRTFIKIDPFSGEKIVYEGWCPILEYGQLKTPGKSFPTETWQQYVVREGDTEISQQVYWTHKKLQQHEAIRTGPERESLLKPGIKEWRAPQVKALPDLAKLGFELIMTDNGDMVYEIYYRLLLECDGANIKFKWQFAAPDTPPFDEFGEPSGIEIKFIEKEDFELSNAAYNPFSRTAAS